MMAALQMVSGTLRQAIGYSWHAGAAGRLGRWGRCWCGQLQAACTASLLAGITTVALPRSQRRLAAYAALLSVTCAQRSLLADNIDDVEHGYIFLHKVTNPGSNGHFLACSRGERLL